jgi:hypothetical protein
VRPQVRAQILQPGVARDGDYRLVAAGLAKQLQGSRYVGASGEAGEDTFLGRQPTSRGNGLLLRYLEIPIDLNIVEEGKITDGVSATLYPMIRPRSGASPNTAAPAGSTTQQCTAGWAARSA